jgi:hypothetical protein
VTSELRAFARRIEEAAMHFSIEVYAATADLERTLNGEEPHGPVFVPRQQAITDYHEANARRARETRKATQ